MIYNDPNWNVLFLQMTAINCRKDRHQQCNCEEYRVWADTEEELVEYAQRHTPEIVMKHKPVIMEYLIWNGVPSPSKSTIRKWTYKPTIPE